MAFIDFSGLPDSGNFALGVAELFDARVCLLGEAPIWIARDDAVWWLDILNSCAHWKNIGHAISGTIQFPYQVSALLPTQVGEWLVFAEDTIDRYGREFTHLTNLARWPHAQKQNPALRRWRSNDAAVAPDGAVICGTMPVDPEELPNSASLYRLDSRGLEEIADGVTISNGLGWSMDGTKMFYVDTPTRRIDVFDVNETGLPTNRRPFIEIPTEWGVPDGLAVDTEDHIWVALWGGARVQRFSPRGQAAGFVEVPCDQVTSCCFAGPEMKKLVITTAAVDCEGDAAAGLTYVFDATVSGQICTEAVL